MFSVIPTLFRQDNSDKHKYPWLTFGAGSHDKLWNRTEPDGGWHGAPAVQIFVESGDFVMTVNKNDSSVRVSGCLSRDEVRELVASLTEWLGDVDRTYKQPDVRAEDLRRTTMEEENSRT